MKNLYKIIFLFITFSLAIGKTLNFNLSSMPRSFDPALATSIDEFNVAIQLFEGLVVFDPETLEPKPGIAESWTISKDGLKYTFKLRKNVRWSDGTPITAETFYKSWLRNLSRETDANYKYLMYYIRNSKKFTEGKVGAKDVGIKAINPDTLVIELEEPVSYFLNLLVLPIYLPLPVHIISKYNSNWVNPENIVCNGPFILSNVKQNEMIVLTKNDRYWNKEKVKLDSINIHIYEDIQKAYDLYIKGELDWLNGVPQDKIDYLFKTRGNEFYRDINLGTEFYAFNLNIPVLKDRRVRRALFLSLIRINLKDIVKLCIPGTGFVPKNMPGYSGYMVREDPEEAKKLLAEAGFPDGKKFPKLRLLINKSEERRKVAEYITKQWKQILNIDVIIDERERSIYWDMYDNLKYDIVRDSWIGDYVDPSTFLEIFLSTKGTIVNTWTNSEYDNILLQARKEQDKTKRMELYKKAEKILIDEAFIIPLYNYINTFLIKTNVSGIYCNLMGVHPLKEVNINK